MRTPPPATASRSALAPYVPRLIRNWSLEPHARVRAIDGSLVSVDISGFTALSEQLAARGREGAEELVSTISSVFSELIEVAERHGGDVLKFRGDALLLLFVGERHPPRACGAASDMQQTIERVGNAVSSAGPFTLRMSAGVHTGLCHMFVMENPHRELIVSGPAATRVFELEDLASATEVVVSAETAAEIDPSWLDSPRGDAFLLARLGSGASPVPPPPNVEGSELESYIPVPLRNHLAAASGEAEHRHVTVSFLKIPATDELLAAEGEDALLARLDRVATEVGLACTRYGITWLESDIDVGAVKLYLTAGAPATTGDDEEGMLRALRDVLAALPDIELRAGVNRGPVFTGDIGAPSRRTYAVMGDPVNLAARLTARAPGRGIMATADVLDRAGTVYHTETEPLLLKGKEQAVIAHVVGDVMGPRPKEPPDLTPIVGREEELAVLSAAIDSARMRQLQLVEIVAEPGLGKSRLVQELRVKALGFQQLEIEGEHYAASEPYGALRGMLRQLVGVTGDRSREEAGGQLDPFVKGMMPDLAPWLPLLAIPFDAAVQSTPESDALDPAAARDRIHETVSTFLERILMMPTLIVVEDGHWLDDASRFLLLHLWAKPALRPWLVCVTTRPGSPSFITEGGPGTPIELEPLDAEASEELAIAVADRFALSVGAMTALTERAGGNPLFVRELVFAAQHGDDLSTLPETVESLLTARIDTLEPADRMLLRYASVVGPRFPLDLLGEILHEEIPDAGHPERWAYLGEFIVPADHDELAFRHDLVRATAYEGLSFRRRREIHSRVGLALERRLGPRADEESALLSLHFHEAHHFERSWRYSVLAADRAAGGYANVVASELYMRALEAANHVERISEDEITAVEEALGDVCDRFGSFEPALDAYRRAFDLANDPIARARLLRKTGVAYERLGRYGDAGDTLVRALGEIEGLERDDEVVSTRAALDYALAAVSYRQMRYEDAIAYADRAIEDAESIGDHEAVARASYVAGGAYDDLGREGGRPYLERAIQIYEELGDDRGLSAALNNLGIHHYTRGRWDESVALYRLSREADERAGDPLNAAVHANNEAEVLSDQGHLTEAEPLFREMVRICDAASFPIGVALGTSNLGRVAARAGRFTEAHDLYRQAIRGFEEIDARRYVTETKARTAECLVFEGRYADAITESSALREAARASPFGGLEALILRQLGLALWQARKPDEARPHLVEALAIARELKAEFEVALTLRAMADVRFDASEELRSESNAILERLGVVSVPAVPLP